MANLSIIIIMCQKHLGERTARREEKGQSGHSYRLSLPGLTCCLSPFHELPEEVRETEAEKRRDSCAHVNTMPMGRMWCTWTTGDVYVMCALFTATWTTQHISGLVSLEIMHEGSGFPVASLGTRRMPRGGGGGGPAPGGGDESAPAYLPPGWLAASLTPTWQQQESSWTEGPTLRERESEIALHSGVFLTHALA